MVAAHAIVKGWLGLGTNFTIVLLTNYVTCFKLKDLLLCIYQTSHVSAYHTRGTQSLFKCFTHNNGISAGFTAHWEVPSLQIKGGGLPCLVSALTRCYHGTNLVGCSTMVRIWYKPSNRLVKTATKVGTYNELEQDDA